MKKLVKSSYFAIIMLFIYIPIVIMIVFSFNSGDTVFNFVSFSGKAYDDFFHNTPFVRSIITSLFVAVISTLVSLIIGVAAAIGLSRCKPITQKAWFNIANIPLINADVVTAVSLMIIFLLSGMSFGIGTLIFAHISFNVPYVLITVMPRLKKVDPSILEAAQDLGSKPYQILWKVVLPILKPAIITAGAIAFAMSFDDFIISYFTGGSQTNVSTFIYTAKKVKPFIYAFGTLLVAVIIFGILIWNVFQAIRSKYKRTEEELRHGDYKYAKFNQYYKELNTQYLILNTKKVMHRSWRPDLWIRYWWTKLLIKIYLIRNYGKRISRLEWKQYEIRNEIRNEKRYYSRLEKTKKQIIKVRKDLKKKTNDPKKRQRLKNQLIRLRERQKELEAEIEWMENRDDKVARQAAKIQRQIDRWQEEFQTGKDAKSLSKKDISWYKKKIKGLEQWKIEVEEGKNHYKLRKTTEKLRELRDLKSTKIFELNTKLNALSYQVYVWKDITYNYDKIINTSHAELEAVLLQAYRQHHLDVVLTRVETKIFKTEAKIAKLQTQVDAKATKVLNLDDEGNDRPKVKNWFQKSWKTLSVAIIAVAAFSGLTVAYVKNNIYDLVVANWGEYIDPDLINQFEKTTGYKINYQTFDANETLYNKLYTFTYDLMVPSDYMIQKLANEDKLALIDWSKLNIEKPTEVKGDPVDNSIVNPNPDAPKEKINERLTALMAKSIVDKTYEENNQPVNYNILNYAVPYFWGDVALVFNQNSTKLMNFLTSYGLTVDANNQVQPSDGHPLDWQILQAAGDAGLRVQLNNDPKNIFLIGAEILYGRTNLKTEAEVDRAYSYLKDLIKTKSINLAEGDNLITTVQEGQFDIAMMYNGDALYSQLNRNTKKFPLDYAYGRVKADGVTSPTGETIDQRTNVYSDSMVVAKKARHKQAAYDFINFIYNAKNALANSSYVGLASPLDSVLTELSDTSVDDGGFAEFKNLYQPIAIDPSYYNGDEPLAFINNNKVDAYLVKRYNDLLTSVNYK